MNRRRRLNPNHVLKGRPRPEERTVYLLASIIDDETDDEFNAIRLVFSTQGPPTCRVFAWQLCADAGVEVALPADVGEAITTAIRNRAYRARRLLTAMEDRPSDWRSRHGRRRGGCPLCSASGYIVDGDRHWRPCPACVDLRAA